MKGFRKAKHKDEQSEHEAKKQKWDSQSIEEIAKMQQDLQREKEKLEQEREELRMERLKLEEERRTQENKKKKAEDNETEVEQKEDEIKKKEAHQKKRIERKIKQYKTMHGFLSKMGHVRKNWKVRYFVIKDDEMYYFQDSSIAALKGKVHLKNCTISIEDGKSFKRDNCFRVNTASSKDFVLSASSDRERSRWIDAIYFVSTGQLPASALVPKAEKLPKKLEELRAKPTRSRSVELLDSNGDFAKKPRDSEKQENIISIHRSTTLSASSPGLSISQKLVEMSTKTSSDIVVIEAEKEVMTVMTKEDMRTSKNVSSITWKELEESLEDFIRNRGFESEWKQLEIEDLKISEDLFNEATKSYNWEKNRYKDVIPYDWTRVKLEPKDGIEGSDYINASFVKSENRSFIAAQAPLPHTFVDFYRMLWEQKTKVVVMLTKLVENGLIKADNYLPISEPQLFGDILVEVSFVSLGEVRISNMKLKKGDEERHITHFLYEDWPDHSIPKEFQTLLGFIEAVNKASVDPDLPIVVHCSAGIGRTGCWILLSTIIEKIDKLRKEEKVKTPQVQSMVLKLRKQRREKIASYAGSTFNEENSKTLSIDSSCGITFGIGYQSFPLIVNEVPGYGHFSIRGLLHSIDVHQYEIATWKIMLYRNPFDQSSPCENLVAVSHPSSVFVDEILKLSNAEYTIVVVTAPDPVEATFFAFDVHKSDLSGRLDNNSPFWFPPIYSKCNSTSVFAPFATVEFLAHQSTIFQLMAFIETPGVNNGMLALFPGHFNGKDPCTVAEPLKVIQSTDAKMFMNIELQKGYYYTLVLSVLPPLHTVDFSIFVRDIPMRDVQMSSEPTVLPVVDTKWCTYECSELEEQSVNFGQVTFVAEGETYLMAPLTINEEQVNYDTSGFRMILFQGDSIVNTDVCTGFLVGTILKETAFVFAPLEIGKNYTVVISKTDFPVENEEYHLMMLTGTQLGHNQTIHDATIVGKPGCIDCNEKSESSAEEDSFSWLTISLSVGGVVVISTGSVAGAMVLFILRKQSAELPYIRRDSSAVMPPGFFIVPRSGSASTVHPYNLLTNSPSFNPKS